MGERRPNVLLVVVDACRFDYLRGPHAETPATDELTGLRRRYADSVVGEGSGFLSCNRVYDGALVVLTANYGEHL